MGIHLKSKLVGGLIEVVPYKDTLLIYNEEGKINQVDMDYYIEILPIDNEAISFELYKENEKLEIIDNKTTKFTLEKGTKKEDNYKIKIIYDENKNTTENIFEEVQIKVHSEQKRA